MFSWTSISRWLTGAGCAVAMLAAAPAWAQGLNLAAQGSDAPLEIYADQGVEWEQANKRMIARGNARAERGTMVLRADMLVAYYSDTGGTTSDIWRLEALGNVRISSPNETAYGDNAVYDVEKAVLVMRGKGLKMVSSQTTITARDTLEYWELRRQLVARGDARAVKDNRTIDADLLVANFAESGPGKDMVLSTVDAYDNVVITTPRERATGNRGTYNAKSNVVTLEGDVQINRGGDVVNGGFATVDLNAGRSTLYASKPGEAKAAPTDAAKPQNRVKLILKPRSNAPTGN